MLIGIAFVRHHRVVWARWREDAALSERERTWHRRQYFRRMRTSSLMVVLGILIPAGDFYFEQNPAPWAFAYFWAGVLGLVGLMLMGGLVDLAATAAHTRVSIGQARKDRVNLQREIDEFRRDFRGGR